MSKIQIEIKDEYFDTFLSFLNLLPEDLIKIKIDSEMIADESDLISYKAAKSEYEKGEVFTLDEIIKERKVV
ncbi:MAG: hypothetical protein JSS63_00220 [Bacteroidetes bacterium]|nr:hypothetical protein [Bacteroidota bacterium]MBX7045028.1 hypothetical protein [Ignavibacteria bacterium]